MDAHFVQVLGTADVFQTFLLSRYRILSVSGTQCSVSVLHKDIGRRTISFEILPWEAPPRFFPNRAEWRKSLKKKRRIRNQLCRHSQWASAKFGLYGLLYFNCLSRIKVATRLRMIQANMSLSHWVDGHDNLFIDSYLLYHASATWHRQRTPQL